MVADPTTRRPRTPSGFPSMYEIRVSGRLDRRWERWFDGLRLTHEDDHTTTLRGTLVDQASLYGALDQLRDLGVTLISVVRIAAVARGRAQQQD